MSGPVFHYRFKARRKSLYVGNAAESDRKPFQGPMSWWPNRVILRCGKLISSYSPYVKADAPGRRRIFCGNPPPLECNALFERQNDRTGNWIGDTETPTKVFESASE